MLRVFVCVILWGGALVQSAFSGHVSENRTKSSIQFNWPAIELKEDVSSSSFKKPKLEGTSFLERLEKRLFTNIQNGNVEAFDRINCRAEYLEKLLKDNHYQSGTSLEMIRKFFSECSYELSKGKSTLFEALQYSNMKYEYWKRSQVRAIKVYDPEDDVYIDAHLALKEGSTPRPLIVYQCGLRCYLGDTTLAYIMMAYFDEGPFNVLLLPSSSSHPFQAVNKKVLFGGFDEGRRILKVAQWLKSKGFPYSNLVSSVHVVGSSLGGHSILFSALYETHMKEEFLMSHPTLSSSLPTVSTNSLSVEALAQPNWVDSYTALCPVVDLEKSVKSIMKPGLIGKIYRHKIWSQFLMLSAEIPLLGSLLDFFTGMPSYTEMPKLIAESAYEFYRQRTEVNGNSWLMPPLTDVRLDSIDEFWDLNRFQKWVKIFNPAYLQDRVFVWAADDDIVVNARNNARSLDDHPGFDVLVTPRGSHCLFSEFYGWRVAGAVLRGRILSSSPEFRSRFTTKTGKIEFLTRSSRFSVESTHYSRLSLEWISYIGNENVKLVTTNKLSECLGSEIITRGAQRCLPVRSTRWVSLASLGFSEKDIPQTYEDAQALTRWLNANIRILNKNKQWVDRKKDPVYYEYDLFE